MSDLSTNEKTPSSDPSVYSAILDGDLEQRIGAMLDEFDDLVPEHYEGYDRPYQPLSKRMDLFEKHIPFGEMLIYTQPLSNHATQGALYSQATLFILTESGYQPLYSRLGEGNVMTSRTDGAIADAETSAIRRILVSLGLSNDGGKEEITVLQDSAERDFITNHLTATGKPLESLIKAYNADKSGGGQGRIEETSNIKDKGVASLSITDVVKLRAFLESK